MQRTIYNCTLIQASVKVGKGKPQQWHNLGKCEGFDNEKNELCDQCKKCRHCIANGLKSN